jgi:hypothetical protein
MTSRIDGVVVVVVVVVDTFGVVVCGVGVVNAGVVSEGIRTLSTTWTIPLLVSIFDLIIFASFTYSLLRIAC